MNQLTVMGRLGADPEVRFTSTGKKVTTLLLAENQKRSGKDQTLWWRVAVWGEQFDKMIAYLKKGSAVVVAGEMPKPEIYNDREGKPQISLSITAYHVSFSPFGRNEKQSQEGEAIGEPTQGHTSRSERGHQQISQGESKEGSYDLTDEEIPF